MSEINFREFREQDYEPVEDMIREAWHYDQMCPPKTAQKMAKAFLSSCLANQTFTQIAVMEGKPVGVIMGKNIGKHHCPFHYRFRQIVSIVSVLTDRAGREISSVFKNVNDIDRQLLKKSNIKYQGELAFFAVCSECRGLGLGKKLYEKLVSYMQSQQIENFFLYTDTSCNYPFYEHQGLKQRCKISHNFSIKDKREEMTFFLYDNLD